MLAHPRIVPIVFAGDDRATDIGKFTSAVGSSSYWTSVASEYGVGAATATPVMIIPEAPPAKIDDSVIQTWLQGKISAPDPSSIYVVFYPATTTITAEIEQSCTSFDGYHSEMKMGATQVVYAVIASCPGGLSTTGVTSHELFEAATDPYPYTAPAYAQIDDTTNGVFYTNHMEIGDLCEAYPEQTPADVGYPVVSVWSNAASLGGHWPCVPNDGSPSFRTMPEAENVPLPPGGVTTLHLLAFSDQPTAAWTIAVKQSAQWNDQLTVSLCRTSAQNGESIPITLERPIVASQPSYVTVESTLGSVTTTASFIVGD